MERVHASRSIFNPPKETTGTAGSVLRSHAYELACADFNGSEPLRLSDHSTALDRYPFVRDGYLPRRRKSVLDGPVSAVDSNGPASRPGSK